MGWILPAGASSYAGEIDWLYYMILVITGLAFVIVEAALIWFLIRYRARPGRRAHYTHGSLKAEAIWTAVPAVVVVVIGLLSAGVWNEIRGRESVPPGSIPIRLVAKQFEWNATYDFSTRNQLHVPAGRPVVVMLEAEDVIHSFFVPAFRVKQDAVPGMTTPVWFEATTPGEYEIACAELCGLGHYRMRAGVTVHAADDYEQWQAAQRSRTVASTP
jgi:cytochrome c oxidase subunit 2